MRRIPFWLRATRVKLGAPARVLTKQGRYKGNTRTGRARVSSYRYPDDPAGFGLSNSLPGPEQVFRVRVRGSVANVGVRITGQPRGVSVTPRLVYGGDENRLAGIPALPVDVNPYRGNLYGDLAARRRREQAFGGRIRRRLRDEIARRIGPVLVPGVDRRQDAPAREAAHSHGDVVARAVRGRQRVGRGSAIDHRPHRRPAAGIHAQVKPPQRAARGSRTGYAPARRQRRGLPGDEELGERRRDPPEHDGLPADVQNPLAVRLLLFDGREVVEVALDTLLEVVAVRANDLEL